jgi:hypothetical protein
MVDLDEYLTETIDDLRTLECCNSYFLLVGNSRLLKYPPFFGVSSELRMGPLAHPYE